MSRSFGLPGTMRSSYDGLLVDSRFSDRVIGRRPRRLEVGASTDLELVASLPAGRAMGWGNYCNGKSKYALKRAAGGCAGK